MEYLSFAGGFIAGIVFVAGVWALGALFVTFKDFKM